ncbi:MAG: hypothetical protein JNM76_02440 [Betaproteobacteria bacterium]|nr:hypothetical protein [Betaproteobacteria bacterium]
MNPGEDHDEAALLLPWHVNGTLDQAARSRVMLALAASPALRAEAGWLSALQVQLRAATPHADPEPAWDRLRQLIAAERQGKLVPLSSRRTWHAPKTWVPLAMAATLVLGVFVGVMHQRHVDDITPLSERRAGPGHTFIQVTFKPSATEGEIRRLVHAINAEIVSGPGALGVYTFRVPSPKAAAALDALRARRDLVETATLVKP